MPRLVVGLLLVAAAQVSACLLGDLCADARLPLPVANKASGEVRFARRGDGREEERERGEKGSMRASKSRTKP
jgi:hypothetical protein